MSKPLIPPLPSDYITAHSYSVTIPNVTVEEAFDKLLSQKAMRDVALLSTWATRFEITKVDKISLPSQPNLSSETELWKAPAFFDDSIGNGLERVFFEMSEVAPYVFGLYKAHLEIVGCQTIDATANTILYESYAAPSGVWVWKLRSIKQVGTGVEVSETLDVTSSKLLKLIIPGPARTAHKEHMDSYYKLFSKS